MSAPSPDPRIARKTGEGYAKPNADQELPIDINYQKLPEWLVSRQKLPADWHKRLEAIKSKVSEAEKELPAGLLSQLPGPADAPVDYFRAVQIRDKLAENGERTLFGGLSGQAGIWDKIVKAYENGGVFVGEAAQTMIQNVDYEIPYLRTQMAKCNQQMADADRRHAEYSRSAVTCANNYKKECEKLGISGTAPVGQELRQLSSKLPGLFLDLTQQLRSSEQLDKAISYYQHFTQYAHGSDAGKQAAAAVSSSSEQQDLPEVLHVLTEVRERRTAAYTPEGGADAANNAAAAGVANAVSIEWGSELSGSLDAATSSSAAGIDWGAADAAAAAGDAGGGISWDLGDLSAAAGGGDEGAAAAGGDGGGISWDVAVEEPAAADAGEAAAAAAGPSLDWDIDMSGIGVESAGESSTAAAAPGIDWGIDLGAAGIDAAAAGSTAAGASSAAAAAGFSGDAAADRLQHDSEYRSQLLDDLQELRAFLLSRKAGLSGSSSSSDLLRALAPDVVASTDAGDVGRMLSCVEGLLAALNDDKLRQLLMISSSSSRYMERLQGSLQRKAGQEARMLAAAAETQARKQESRATLVGLQPKLAEIVAQTRSVKKAVEAALAKQFAGRRVNVLGEINNALTASS